LPLREAGRDRHVFALELARPPVPVPLLVGRADRLDHLVGQLELLGQRLRHARVLADHVVHLAVAGDRELEPDPEAVQGRVARPQQTQPRRGRAHASQLPVVLAGLQRDVVAEPLRLLVGVRMAAHVDEQRGVVDDGALVLVEPQPLGEP